MYTRGDAVALRDLLLPPWRRWRRPSRAVEPVVVIVGAGPTGVELAGALAELRNKAMPVMYPELDPARVRVVLVEMTDHVLGQFSPKLRRYAADELQQRGVDVRLPPAATMPFSSFRTA